MLWGGKSQSLKHIVFHCVLFPQWHCVWDHWDAVVNQTLSRWCSMMYENQMVLSCIHNPSVLQRSPTPLSYMQPQNRTKPPSCFRDGCRHAPLYLSPNQLHIYNQKFQIRIHHTTRPSNTDFQCSSCVMWHSSAFSTVSLYKYGFLTATLPMSPFLMRLQWTVDGSAEGSDESLRFFVRPLVDCFLFLKNMTVWIECAKRKYTDDVQPIALPYKSFFLFLLFWISFTKLM